MDEPGETDKKTRCLVFSIIICVTGNSFLYGYNIGVLNSTSTPTKAFSEKEKVITADENSLHYPDPQPIFVSNQTYGDDKGNVTRWQKSNAESTVSKTLQTSSKDSASEFTNIYLDGFIVALYGFWGAFGALVSSTFAKNIGCKRGLLIITPLILLAAVLGVIATLPRSSDVFLILVMFFRSFAGFYGGINVNLASMYLYEISPKEYRRYGEKWHHVFVAVGFLCSMVFGLPQRLGNWNVWAILFGFSAIPSLAFILLFPLCADSPRYLFFMRHDEDGAMKALRRLRGTNNVDDELERMKEEERLPVQLKSYSLKQLLMIPELKKPIVGVFILSVAQQLSGQNAIMSYSFVIFSQAGIREIYIPYLNLGLGIFLTFGAFVSMRQTAYTPMRMKVIMLVAAVSLVIILMLTPPKDEFSLRNISFVFALWIFMLCSPVAFGLGTVPELVEDAFPSAAHDVLRSIMHTVGALCNFVLLLVFLLIKVWLQAYTYIIFVVALLFSIIADLLLRSREEIQRDASTNVVPESTERLLEENKRLREAVICNRCNTKTKSVLYNQCGHILFCSSCDLSVYPIHCPECKEHIRPYTKVKLLPTEYSSSNSINSI